MSKSNKDCCIDNGPGYANFLDQEKIDNHYHTDDNYLTSQKNINKIVDNYYYKIQKEETMIEISLKEYKELLEIKGRYEELKSQQNIIPKITYYNTRTGDPLPEPPYKITC